MITLYTSNSVYDRSNGHIQKKGALMLNEKRLAILAPVLLGFLITTFGCSPGIKKANITAGQSPEEVTAILSNLITKGYEVQSDAFSPDDFKKGKEFYEESQEELSEKKVDLDDFYEEAGYSMAFLERSISKAEQRQGEYNSIFLARRAAINAGAKGSSQLSKDLNEVDQQIKKYSSDFGKPLGPKKYIAIQQDYLDLEIRATQRDQLGRAEALLKLKDAKRKAPKSLNQATIDIETAKNVIASNVREPDQYSEAVDQALISALMLSDVMQVIKDRGGDLEEAVAREIVNKDRALANQDFRIDELRATIGEAEEKISGLDTEMENLEKDREIISLQEAFENARKEISVNEAEVYQQGNRLIFRLKKVDFPIGKSEVPITALPILEKVEEIITKVNPDKVLIEGHTDSTGSAKLNRSISKQRANNVAKYFKQKSLLSEFTSKGYGPDKPLAPNTTKKGRALNRRVDIIIEVD